MKVLFIDISLNGHRLGYLRALTNSVIHSVMLLPENSEYTNKQYVAIKSGFDKKRNLKNYLGFIKEIRSLIESQDITCVHFLCGDALYRFFGIGLSSLKVPTYITFHHMVFNKVKFYSIKSIFKNIDYGIVHTSSLLKELEKRKIMNVIHIEYPVFNKKINTSVEESCEYFNLPNNKKIPIITVLGGTQRYKGLDLLLNALKLVDEDFILFICGPERDFSKEYIERETISYRGNVVTNLRFLTDLEFANAINASNIIALPYRYEFDGASGPLAESVMYRKYIIGSSHGSLGNIITTNELGCTFITEDFHDLAEKLKLVLSSEYQWSMKAEEYRNSLRVEQFCSAYIKVYEMRSNSGEI